MTPLEHFTVLTPLGRASCTGVCVSEDPEWCCWLYSTGEVWWFGNQHIRRDINVTNVQMNVSGFSHINKSLRTQIDRYIKNKWLPENYDPANPDTWRF